MGLYPFSLVQPWRLNLPVDFTSAVVYLHQFVRWSDTPLTKNISNFTGNYM